MVMNKINREFDFFKSHTSSHLNFDKKKYLYIFWGPVTDALIQNLKD